jgi:hypothetical protein
MSTVKAIAHWNEQIKDVTNDYYRLNKVSYLIIIIFNQERL